MERKIKFKNLIGCLYGSSDGKMCAALGCQAQYALNNANDIVDVRKKNESIKRIKERAKAAGCKSNLTIKEA